MTAWMRNHARSLAAAIGRMVRSPGSTLANVLVIGAVLALPLLGVAGVRSLEHLAGQVAGAPVINVFLAMDAKQVDIDRVRSAIKDTVGVARVTFVPKDAALDRLRKIEGLGEAIGVLQGNPLPDAMVVELAQGDPAIGDAVAARIRGDAKVAHIQWDAAWHRRVDAMLGIGRVILGVLSVVLGLTLVAVIFNTVRLQLLGSAQEIDLHRLVGATDAYIRRPFWYYGAAIGAVGGAIGVTIAAAFLGYLSAPVAALAREYGSGFRLESLDALEVAAAVAAGMLLGLVSAALCVSIHLRRGLRRLDSA